jgi:phosphopantothenoylcysteine decarboxylase/phosphopantothenate--cysteine ligase
VHAEFEDTHLLLMAAAVADFRPARAEAGKIARDDSGPLDLRLEATDDILASVARVRRSDQTVVAFAAEHGGDAVARAREKLHRKGVDAIVVNDVSRPQIGFDSELNEVVIVDAEREHPVPLGPKEEVAGAILDRVQEISTATSGGSRAGGAARGAKPPVPRGRELRPRRSTPK